MILEPFINLFSSTDKGTRGLIKRLDCELKVYNSHIDYVLFGDLVKNRLESDKLSLKHMVYSEDFGLVLSQYLDTKNIQCQGSLLCITPFEDALRFDIRKESFIVSDDIKEKDIIRLFNSKQSCECMYLCVDWNKQLCKHLRLLMHLSFVLDWNRCRGIAICNYEENPTEYMIQDIQLFLKGVLNNFSHEEFIFHPFRPRS